MVSLIRLYLFLFLALVPFATAQAVSDRTLWQIGKFDQSPVEFLGRPAAPVIFHVGKSDATRDWPGHQVTGQPYKILFPLESVSGSYSLRVAALIDEPRVPAFRTDVNGHAGTFYLHPKLSYSRSDFTYAFDPHESQSTLQIDIPASFLTPGENAMTITCMDDPPTPAGEEEIGGISYDALSLEHDSNGSRTSRAKVDIEPTIFFHSNGEGITEVLDGFVRFARPWLAGTADLELAGKHYSASFPAGEFGEERLTFDVPRMEWNGSGQSPNRLGPQARI